MTKMSPLDPPTGIRPEEFGAGILVNGVLWPFDAGKEKRTSRMPAKIRLQWSF